VNHKIALGLGLLIVLCGSGIAQTDVSLHIPEGSAPVLDGCLGLGEWTDAIDLPLGDTCTLLAKHASGFLFLGIRAQTGSQIVGNVYVSRDSEVRILHASHALGTATYVQADGTWSLDRSFAWACRRLGFTDSALAERSAFLDESDWLASVVRLGPPHHMEYQIAIHGEPMQMLFRFDLHGSTTPILTWPIDVEIGIEPGPLPQTAGFRPHLWGLVTLDSKP